MSYSSSNHKLICLELKKLALKNKKPTPEQMKGLDVVIFDIQDVGCRFYTYISTLSYLMEAAAKRGFTLTEEYEDRNFDFRVNPADVIVLEGLFVLEDEEIKKRLDIKVYIDTDADIRFIRRLNRDVKERGRTLESVCDQYLKTVRVMHDAFVEPSKKYADVIIPEGSHNNVAIDLLVTKISSIISPESNQ